MIIIITCIYWYIVQFICVCVDYMSPSDKNSSDNRVVNEPVSSPTFEKNFMLFFSISHDLLVWYYVYKY